MKPTYINPEDLGAPRGFNHGVLYPPGGRLLFLAGQNGSAGGADFAAQFEHALRNLVAVIREAGGEPENLGVLNIFVTSKADYGAARQAIGEAWKRIMGRHYPAMAMYEVKGLWEDWAKVELEGIAILPSGDSP